MSESPASHAVHHHPQLSIDQQLALSAAASKSRRTLFESPTVAGLSALIVQSQAEGLGEDELAQLLSEAQEQGSRE